MVDYRVIGLPAFKDNYLWLLVRENYAILIDPGDPVVCINALVEKKLALNHIFITHHHNDHIGGLEKLSEYYSCPVYGPHDNRIPKITRIVSEGTVIRWRKDNFQILHLPGHTQTHVVYWNPHRKHLFCGDVLFSAGCGRIMEGEAADLYHSLQRIAQLPADTEIFCAHEYTLNNLKFAMHLEPDNLDMQKRYQQVSQLRKLGQASIPTRLDIELVTNPFLRSHLPAIRKLLDSAAAQPEIQKGLSKFKLDTIDEYYFAVMRLWKNTYV